jgi:hypothetical protein
MHNHRWQVKIGDFWAKVDRSGGPDACWLWLGSHQKKTGYGSVTYHGKPMLAHRVAWIITNGLIPDGLKACHTCDVRYPLHDRTYRLCCNPAHIFLGTQNDNMQDMVAKGRSGNCGAPGKPKPDHARPRGERNGHARITSADVLRIRRLWETGQCTVKHLANLYGMSDTNARSIIQRKTWAHLSP